MHDIRLSICIPTYNFAEFIGETLESIIEQISDEVEIIIGDGGSTDNTAEVVSRYQSHFFRLTYHNFGKKSGVDLDLSKTVELARGDYCWLMSSDDVLKAGAIQRVLSEIRSGYDVYLLNRTMCDRFLRPIRRQKSWLLNKATDSVYHLSNKSQLLAYLNRSESIGALFSYISCIIVCRKKWNEIGYDERFTGSNYAHVFRLFSVLLNASGNGLKYIEASPVLCRGDNDSFLNEGLANRFRIDFDGYRLLAESMFHDDEVRNAFKAIMRRHHKWYILPRLRGEVDDRKWKDVRDTLLYYGYGTCELFLIDLLGSSSRSVRVLRSAKKRLQI